MAFDLKKNLLHLSRELYGSQHRAEIAGIYTMLEESNTIGTMARTTDLSGHFLEPLARDIKQNISADLLVWAGPYFVANLTRHPLTVRHVALYMARTLTARTCLAKCST